MATQKQTQDIGQRIVTQIAALETEAESAEELKTRGEASREAWSTLNKVHAQLEGMSTEATESTGLADSLASALETVNKAREAVDLASNTDRKNGDSLAAGLSFVTEQGYLPAELAEQARTAVQRWNDSRPPALGKRAPHETKPLVNDDGQRSFVVTVRDGDEVVKTFDHYPGRVRVSSFTDSLSDSEKETLIAAIRAVLDEKDGPVRAGSTAFTVSRSYS